MYLNGNVGSSPSTSMPSAPPSPASPLPSAKLDAEHAVDRDPEAGRGVAVVDRGAQLGAEPGARDQRVQRRA